MVRVIVIKWTNIGCYVNIGGNLIHSSGVSIDLSENAISTLSSAKQLESDPEVLCGFRLVCRVSLSWV